MNGNAFDYTSGGFHVTVIKITDGHYQWQVVHQATNRIEAEGETTGFEAKTYALMACMSALSKAKAGVQS